MKEKFETIIVDDDPILIILLTNLIKKNNLHSNPKAFKSGKDVLSYFSENYKETENYLIFLDINMQPISGFDVLEEISKIAKPINTMIFIVSSSIDKSDSDYVANNEFVLEYLTKPVFGPAILHVKEIVEERLGK